MTKRFGRNQKRRLKAQLADVQAQLEKEKRIGQQNREAVASTARVLGDYFIGLPPEKRTQSQVERIFDGWRLTKLGHGIPLEYMKGSTLNDAILHMEMYARMGSVDIKPLTDMKHARLIIGQKVVGYRLTSEAMRNASPKVLARHIGEVVAETIAEQRALS